MELEELKTRLQEGWSRETSADPHGWTSRNPSHGQCSVTSCIVQDVLGGEVVCAEARIPGVGKGLHYFNKLPDGTILDLTLDQFPRGTVFEPPEGRPQLRSPDGVVWKTTREAVLFFDIEPWDRYSRLRAAVGLPPASCESAATPGL